jgi:hypothetical protein
VLSASRQSAFDPAQPQESTFSIVPLVTPHGAYEQVSVCSSQYDPFPRHVFGEVLFV